MVPKVSIILTSRDKFELLRLALDSVLNQTFKDWELIICDDDSRDSRILELYGMVSKSRQRFIVHRGRSVSEGYRKTHKMVAVRINAGIGVARGKYVTYLGDDNEWYPDRCERMVRELDADPGLGMVVDNAEWITFEGKVFHQDKLRYKYREILPGHEKLLEAIRPSNYIVNDCVMHRQARKCCRSWDTDVRHPVPVDWRYWLRLVDRERFKVKKLDLVGTRAYYPGTWRNGVTVQQALATRPELPRKVRRKVMQKKEDKAEEAKVEDREQVERPEFVVNTSGKIQQFTNRDNNRLVVVKPGERVRKDVVSFIDGNGNERIYPGFTYEGRLGMHSGKSVEEIAEDEKPSAETATEYETVDDQVEDPPVMEDDDDVPALSEGVGRKEKKSTCIRCGGSVGKKSKTGICFKCWRAGERP